MTVSIKLVKIQKLWPVFRY